MILGFVVDIQKCRKYHIITSIRVSKLWNFGKLWNLIQQDAACNVLIMWPVVMIDQFKYSQ